MPGHNDQKQGERNSGINQAVIAIAGAIVGAGVAVAAGMVLKDDKNKDKAKEALSNALDFTMNHIKNLKKESGLISDSKTAKK